MSEKDGTIPKANVAGWALTDVRGRVSEFTDSAFDAQIWKERGYLVKEYVEVLSPKANSLDSCPHCDGTGDASARGRIEECCACEGTGKVAPVDVYRILKAAADNGVLDREHITSLSRKIAALYPPLQFSPQ